MSNYIPSPKSKQSPQHTCSTTLWLLLPHCLASQALRVASNIKSSVECRVHAATYIPLCHGSCYCSRLWGWTKGSIKLTKGGQASKRECEGERHWLSCFILTAGEWASWCNGWNWMRVKPHDVKMALLPRGKNKLNYCAAGKRTKRPKVLCCLTLIYYRYNYFYTFCSEYLYYLWHSAVEFSRFEK